MTSDIMVTPDGWHLADPTTKDVLFFRDTPGGLQYISCTKPGYYDLTQQGWFGILHRSVTIKESTQYADALKAAGNLRILNMDLQELSVKMKHYAFQAFRAVEGGDIEAVENARAGIFAAEMLLRELRRRLSIKNPHESRASRAERIGSDIYLTIINFFTSLFSKNDPVQAMEALEPSYDHLDSLRDEAREFIVKVKDLKGGES